METDSVKIDFYFEATIAAVWKAWTDPAIMIQWFGSEPEGVGLHAEADARPGKTFSVTFRDTNGTEHICFGTYMTVIEPAELSFSWCWKSEPDVTSMVSLRFEEQDGGTLMYFEHANVGTESAHDYLAGWTSTFFKLQKVVEG